MKRRFETVKVDADGRILLPPELARRLGVTPGAVVRVREDGNAARIGRSSANLDCVYVEPTNRCNLTCTTCMRNVWHEPEGLMSPETWARLLAGLERFTPRPSLFFGGYGEPLSHPQILAMIEQARSHGIMVELITNGTLLDGEPAKKLIALGLQRLWVSLDESDPDPYASVRRGGSLPGVVENMARLQAERERALSETPLIGICFVAMKDTIASLPRILRLGKRLGADRFLVSNLLAHTAGMCAQALYHRSYYEPDVPATEHTPLVELPRMELNDVTQMPLTEVLKDSFTVSIAGQTLTLGSCTCPFVEKGSTSVRWDGSVSPCTPLMHSHASWLGDRERNVESYSVGNLASRGLREIWDDPAYSALREKLLAFDFAPCTTCNGCEEAGANRADCFGNTAPACGGCLWAQGFIRCP